MSLKLLRLVGCRRLEDMTLDEHLVRWDILFNEMTILVFLELQFESSRW